MAGQTHPIAMGRNWLGPERSFTVHRGDCATARDLFDLAMVAEREPDALAAAAPFLMRHRDRFLEQIGRPGPGFVATVEAIAATAYRPSLEHCVEVATAYLSALKDR